MNGDVQVRIIEADGSDGGHELNAVERALVEGAEKALSADREFRQTYPGARLVLVESNRGLADTARGRVYLRYDVPGMVPQEFWANEAKEDHVNLKTGVVGVTLVGK